MKYLIGCAYLLFCGLSSAQTPYPMEESALLWKIEGDGVQKGSYLFGTMHLIEKEYFLFPAKLEKAFSKADVLVMELPGLPNQLEAMKYLKLENETFFDYFSTAQSDSIIDWVTTHIGMSEESFRKNFTNLKPFAVSQLATQVHFIGKTESYEMTFDKLARENGMKIRGLETVAEQMKIFDDLSREQQAEMVMSSVRKPKEGIEMTRETMQIYSRQEVDSLYMMIEEQGELFSEEQAVFLDDRNKKWIPQIEAYIKENRTFIAVGAGHLGGPNGVIRLLEERGYTLTPVRL